MNVFNREHWHHLIRGLFLILVASLVSVSQVREVPTSEPPPPKAEEFGPSSDIIVPWRDGNCLRLVGGRRNGSGCYVVTAAQYVSRTTATLYKDDASVWFAFDLNHKNSGYFGKVTSVDFIPFATPGINSAPPVSLVLRINGESENWYRVIVNEESGAVAYIRKGDPDWWKTTFEYYLKGNKAFSPLPGGKIPPLSDAPNGKALPESEFMRFDIVDFIKLDKPDGEWAYVAGEVNGKPYRGWLRWREGRKFLVDCYFALKKAPWLQ